MLLPAPSRSFELPNPTFELWILLQFAIGISFILTKNKLKKRPASSDSKDGKSKRQALITELTRKSFHILGGTTIVFCYHFGMKLDIFAPGYAFAEKHGRRDFAHWFLPFVVTTWMLDFLRQVRWPWTEVLIMT